MLVVINAGHFVGVDPGAPGSRSTEAKIVRYISEVVVNDLEAKGIEAQLITDDSLSEVCRQANAYNADLFVSIHCNSAPNYSAHGTETYYYAGSEHSYKLASCIQAQLLFTMGTSDRGLKDGSWLYVLKHTAMPAVLTEIGFISNYAEETYIIEHKRVIAHAIARGIIDFLGRE